MFVDLDGVGNEYPGASLANLRAGLDSRIRLA